MKYFDYHGKSSGFLTEIYHTMSLRLPASGGRSVNDEAISMLFGLPRSISFRSGMTCVSKSVNSYLL